MRYKSGVKVKRNYNADFLRFFLALAVVLCHAFYLSQNQPDPVATYTHDVINIGAIAVSVFFAFSGYYVTMSLLHKGSKGFIENRLSRLLPELWVVVLLTILVVGPIFTDLSLGEYLTSPGTWLYLLNAVLVPWHFLPGVFSNNTYGGTVNGSLWTLPVEFLCYIYIFIVEKLKLLSKKRFKYVYLVSALTAIGVYLVAKDRVFIIFSMTRPFMAFITAVALAIYCDLDKISWKKYGAMLLALVLAAAINQEALLSIACYVIWPVLVLGVTSKLKQVPQKFANWGGLSYAIYLVGFVIQQCLVQVFGGSMNPLVNFGLASIISIVAALCVKLIADKVILIFSKERKVIK